MKKELIHTKIEPTALAEIVKADAAFQGYEVKQIREITFPLLLGSEEMILDFGDHYTGYLHFELEGGTEGHIPDSPTVLEFEFAEMPIELMEEVVPNERTLSVGWLQTERKAMVFMPYCGSLERRYSFRYLRVKRVDSVRFDIKIKGMYLDAVSAVRMEDLIPYHTEDELLSRIDYMCAKTLKECEQEVFEDGPKRDRRLWIGDLRLQALTDHYTFQNNELVRHCIRLFATHLNRMGLVAPCVFPDTKPYIDEWFYLDYSLCLVLCLADYCRNTGDVDFVNEFYPVAEQQIHYTESVFDRKSNQIAAPFFIDHGGYDRSVAALGYFAYVLGHMLELAKKLYKPTEWLQELLSQVRKALLTYQCEDDGLFYTAEGECSWQSQVWAVLSGALTKEACRNVLKETEQKNPSIRMSSPFMTHYYLEALYLCGESEKAFAYIKEYWGAILNAGFDCCPECFDQRDEMLSPYGNPVLNSACHAWSCTASYWIRKYQFQE